VHPTLVVAAAAEPGIVIGGDETAAEPCGRRASTSGELGAKATISDASAAGNGTGGGGGATPSLGPPDFTDVGDCRGGYRELEDGGAGAAAPTGGGDSVGATAGGAMDRS
jgi:hypothetical protein